MKTIIIAAIASLGAMSTFAGSAIADVSINIRFGSTPTYRSHDSYRSNHYRHVYPSYPNNYGNGYNPYGYNRNVNSSVIVREVYPSTTYYGNSWNQVVPSPNPYSTIRSTVYDPFNVYTGDRYIVEKRIIRVR